MIINQKRAEVSLDPLKIVVVDLIKDDSHDDKVSSTYFRQYMTELISGAQLIYLKESWYVSLKDLGVEPPQSEAWMWRLFRLYCQPWRKYHTLRHIDDLCHKIDALEGLDNEKKAVLKLTAFFHDAIYTPTSNQNEKVIEPYPREALCSCRIS